MIGIPHRVTVYIDKICDVPPYTELQLRSVADPIPKIRLRRDDLYVERVRWWRIGSWRSKKRRAIDVKRSVEIPRLVRGPL